MKKKYTQPKLQELGDMIKHEKCGKYIIPDQLEVSAKDKKKFCQCEPEIEGLRK